MENTSDSVIGAVCPQKSSSAAKSSQRWLSNEEGLDASDRLRTASAITSQSPSAIGGNALLLFLEEMKLSDTLVPVKQNLHSWLEGTLEWISAAPFSGVLTNESSQM